MLSQFYFPITAYSMPDFPLHIEASTAFVSNTIEDILFPDTLQPF